MSRKLSGKSWSLCDTEKDSSYQMSQNTKKLAIDDGESVTVNG